MKCKRCREIVPDDVEACPNCGEDLSSLRQLLTDFYTDEPARAGKEEPRRSEPEVFPAPPRKEPSLPVEEIRIATGPPPGYHHEFLMEDALSADEPQEEEEKKPSTWERALRGGFWVRFMALATDYAVLFFLLALFLVLGFLTLTLAGEGGRQIPLLRQVRVVLPIVFPLGLVLTLTYFTFFHGTWGQTIGKMIYGLRVVRTDGQPLTFSRAFWRSLAYFLSAAPFFLGFLWVAFTSSKRSWHDLLADTMVIREQ